jgi:hypothetical protein
LVNDLILEQLRLLAHSLGGLHGRVRTAVAGEISRAVAEAVGETLATLMGGVSMEGGRWPGRPSRAHAYSQSANGYDDWDDADDWENNVPDGGTESDADCAARPWSMRLFDRRTTAALALAVMAGRWWCAREPSSWSALAVSLAVGGTALGGGPLVQAALRVFWAVHRLLAATDALGEGAELLDRL